MTERTKVTRLRNEPIEGQELDDGGQWSVSDNAGNAIIVEPGEVAALVAVAVAIQSELEMRSDGS